MNDFSDITLVDLTPMDITQTDLTPIESLPYLGGKPNNKPMTSREWLCLGVLAVEAASRAQKEGNFFAEERYCALAKKCDALAEQAKR